MDASIENTETVESLEQANSWLTRRLQWLEEQVREGEDVNMLLSEENHQLKEVGRHST